MDILALDPSTLANEGAVLDLRDPTGAPMLKDDGSPVTLTLLGADSDVYVKASQDLTNRALRNRGKQNVTAASLLADQINLLAKVTVGWDGIGLGEKETGFSEENAKRLYRIAFIREQAEAFIADRGNFSTVTPKT
jgi:hypothetical protein